jgi:hypothetical protein
MGGDVLGRETSKLPDANEALFLTELVENLPHSRRIFAHGVMQLCKAGSINDVINSLSHLEIWRTRVAFYTSSDYSHE